MVSLIFLSTIIILVLNLPFITVLQYWWAFLTGAVISGTVLVFCVISVIVDIAERKRRK
jgi:amino acid transporter